MKQIVRIALMPLGILMLVIGFITGHLLVFGITGVGLIIFDLFLYSSKKSRIRYWMQGYKMQLEINGKNEKEALKSVHNDFCRSKYSDENICNAEYLIIDDLVEDIIKKEFKFERIVQPSSSIDNLRKDLLRYKIAIEKLKTEIINVHKEIL